jgi:hypothetical protein
MRLLLTFALLIGCHPVPETTEGSILEQLSCEEAAASEVENFIQFTSSAELPGVEEELFRILGACGCRRYKASADLHGCQSYRAWGGEELRWAKGFRGRSFRWEFRVLYVQENEIEFEVRQFGSDGKNEYQRFNPGRFRLALKSQRPEDIARFLGERIVSLSFK